MLLQKARPLLQLFCIGRKMFPNPIKQNPLAQAQAQHQLLLQISARKNLALSQRMLHTAPKTIRGRLLSYLSQQALEAGSRRFAIPFDRQQLADYLGVDRSALSGELSKMQREGLLQCRKNVFELNETGGIEE